MVRPVKLQSTPSGAYYNLGIGITDSATVSYPHLEVENVAVSLGFSLYPNPATNVINVAITAEMPALATLCIVNVKGERFAASTKQLHAGANVYSLQVSDLPAGIYTVQLTSGGKKMVEKWVKL
jgi:hypothetical protein